MDATIPGATPTEVLSALGAARASEYAPVVINGADWHFYDWNTGPWISRAVPAGVAQIRALAPPDVGFHLTMKAPAPAGVTIEDRSRHADLTAAVAAAESYQWATRQHLGFTWFRSDWGSSSNWMACLGPSNMVKLVEHKDRFITGFSVEREIQAATGETYTIKRACYSSDERGLIATFEEAAAVALTLPTFMAAMMTQAEDSRWPPAPTVPGA